MPEDIYTVSEINTYIKGVINAAFPQPLWICGEIQGYDRNKGKSHVFFELVEKDKRSDSVLAKIGLVIFSNRRSYIDQILRKSENGFELKDDIEVKFQCRMDFYPPHGAMRLIVETIDATYTLGKLAQQRQKIIADLRERGLLDKNKQLAIPTVPLNIGLITSDDSAAYNDFISELARSGYGFRVYLKNSSMQGQRTEGDVTRAIAALEEIRELDVIVITRGGGSIADLSDFDNKLIAEKIAACRLPVLSGIGHEINTTITDMAAHTFAKTPTAIAQYLVLLVKDYLGELDTRMEYILGESQKFVREERSRLKDLSVGLQQATGHFLKDYNRRLDEYSHILRKAPLILLKDSVRRLKDLSVGLQQSTNHFLKNYNQRLIECSHSLTKAPGRLLRDARRQIGDQRERLMRVATRRVDQEKTRLGHFTKIVEVYHPINTMKRGFSITRDSQGRVLRSVDAVKEGDQIVTQVVGGERGSQVKTIKRENSRDGEQVQ